MMTRISKAEKATEKKVLAAKKKLAPDQCRVPQVDSATTLTPRPMYGSWALDQEVNRPIIIIYGLQQVDPPHHH